MRTARSLLTFLAPVALLASACGARSMGDWPAPGSGGVSDGGASGGVASLAGTGGVPAAGGGSPTFGGTPLSGGFATGGFATGGLPTTGGLGTGGFASGGVTSGGQSTGGSTTGGKPCFETTQPSDGLCIHVKLCSEAQYETLCLLETPSSAICFCYTDGAVTSAASVQSATYDSLCSEAEQSRCP